MNPVLDGKTFQAFGKSIPPVNGCTPFNAQAEIAALRGLVADLKARMVVLEQAQVRS